MIRLSKVLVYLTLFVSLVIARDRTSQSLTTEELQNSSNGLVSLAEQYHKAGETENAANIYYKLYQENPTSEDVPMALYTAGTLYQSLGLFERAIEMYELLGQYPETEYALDGFYAIGFCYESMNRFEKVAEAFANFANIYPQDRTKQSSALLLAGKTYELLGNIENATLNYELGTIVYDKYHESKSISPEIGAELHYRFAEVNRLKFNEIEMIGANSIAVQAQLNRKIEALRFVLEPLATSIGIGVQEWALNSTYGVAITYGHFAETLRNQPLFGTKWERRAAETGIISGFEQYYHKMEEKLLWVIETARAESYTSEIITKAESLYLKTGHRQGLDYERFAEMYRRSSLIPKGLDTQAVITYLEESRHLQSASLDSALVTYEETLQSAVDLGLEENKWCTSIRKRINFVKKTQDVLAR